jgi:hypothetical protein
MEHCYHSWPSCKRSKGITSPITTSFQAMKQSAASKQALIDHDIAILIKLSCNAHDCIVTKSFYANLCLLGSVFVHNDIFAALSDLKRPPLGVCVVVLVTSGCV